MPDSNARAELASLATMLEEATARVAKIAESASEDERHTAPELFEIERELRGAARRLSKLVGDLEAAR